MVFKQRRNSASFAQASPSRLSEGCRITSWLLAREICSGDQC